jgi:recombination protein U
MKSPPEIYVIKTFLEVIYINTGKQFERDFILSFSADFWKYRLRDNPAAWHVTNDGNSRFTTKNICDYIVYDYKNGRLLLLELKSTKQKSMPFINLKKHQIDSLFKSIKYAGVVAYFVFEFRTQALVFAIPAETIYDYYSQDDRKSFSLDWCRKNGIQISCQLRRTHYSYSVDVLLNL